jgi:2-polyprenyl-3-methyl-5-hydroxy-6-metoxy-1,4-benzoquinol methylase
MRGITDPDPARHAGLVQHYDSLAPRYSTLYQGRSRLAHFYNTRLARVRELLEGTDGSSVLEVGCGPGYMAPHVARRGMRYYGVDVSPGMIKVCRQTHGALEGVHFAVGDTQALAFPDASFDLVLCLGMLEYVHDETVPIREIARVLVAGGSCILSGINRWSPYNAWDRSIYRPLTRWSPAGIVHEYHTAAEYRDWLQEDGLSILDVVYFDFALVPRPFDRFAAGLAVGMSERLEGFGRSWCRGVANGFLVRAQKGIVTPSAGARGH